MKLFALVLTLTLCATKPVMSQQKEADHPQAIKAANMIRARSIVDEMNIRDKAKQDKVQSILAQHLDSLQVVFKERKRGMDAAAESGGSKELAEARAKAAWDAANGRFNKLHAYFLGRLSVELTAEQNEQLKNLMTENGLQREYSKFLIMFPALTDLQKAQVLAYLKEARDNAMNAETPDNRVEWFIKYRGRTNNFLAAAGYDLRKATEEMQKGATTAK